ncbi:DUF3458 domain-containing protein [Serratia ureilytica]
MRDEYDAETQQYRPHVSQQTAPTADQPEKLPPHIPLDIELYDSEGNVIPLQKGGLPVNNAERHRSGADLRVRRRGA